MSHLMEIFNNEQPLISMLFVLQLLGLGTVMLISFERFYRFRRAKIDLKSFLQGIFNVLQTNKVMEAISICDKFSTPVSEVVRAMVLSPESENAVLAKETAGNVGEVEIGRYEVGLRTLASLVYVGAFLGLIGVLTSFGMSFSGMSADMGRFPFEVLRPHLEDACLLATSGMILSTVSYISYHYFLGKLDLLRLDMEKAAIEMSYFLIEKMSQGKA